MTRAPEPASAPREARDPEPRALPTTPWLRLPLSVVAICSVVYVLRVPDSRTPWWGIYANLLDVNVYRWGGEAALRGGPLYEGLLQGPELFRGFPPMPFTYPPFSALLFAPLSSIANPLMEAAWTVLTLVLVYVAVRMSFALLGYRADRVTRHVSICLACVALLLEPVRTTVWLGQINVLLLVLVLGDELASRRGSGPGGRWWHRLAGAGSGLAAGIKLTPAFFWMHWLVTGRWRMALTSVAAFAGTAAVGAILLPRDSWQYWTRTMFESERIMDDPTPSNQSVRGVLARLLGAESAPVLPWLALCAVVAALGLGAAVLVYRSGHHLLALTASGMTMTMVSPFSWGHHWVWFVPLLVLTVHHALDQLGRRPRAARTVAACTAPLAVLALTGAWVQNFPTTAYPDDRWVATGLFMHHHEPLGAANQVLQAVYPLVWLLVVGSIAVLAFRSYRRIRRSAPVD